MVMELINYSPNHIMMKATEEDGFVWFFVLDFMDGLRLNIKKSLGNCLNI